MRIGAIVGLVEIDTPVRTDGWFTCLFEGSWMFKNKQQTQPAEKAKSDGAAREQLADDLGYLLARYWLDRSRLDANGLGPLKPPIIRLEKDGNVR